MVERLKPTGIRELEKLAELIDEAAFEAAFDAAADELWHELTHVPVIRAAASSRAAYSIPRTAEPRLKLVPRKLETLSLPQGPITFWIIDRRPFVTLFTCVPPAALLLGPEQRKIPLRASEAHPGYFELQDATSAEIEEFLEDYHRSPSRYRPSWE